jgi:uncharacterized protein
MLALRLLLLFVICYIVILALKSLTAGNKAKSDDAVKIGEQMVLDPQCQTYVPKSDAVARQGKFFCSEECARRYLAG